MMFKIFPGTITQDGQKVPLIKGWQDQATNDPIKIKQWQDTFNGSLKFYGVPTGTANDLLVLDIDIKPGQPSGWDTINNQGLQLPDTLSQKTLNGGSHYFFKYPKDGKKYGNKVRFLPGLDRRGEGGYVFYYGVGTDWSKPILEAPAWLLDEKEKVVDPVKPQVSNMTLQPDIAIGIFNSCLDAVRNAPAGESNNTLNTESFKVGQLISSGAISRELAEAELFKAAKLRGKPDHEAKATIRSGLEGGIKNPLICPFPSVNPTPAFALPDIPATPEITRWTPSLFTKYDLMNMAKLRKPQLFKDWSTEDIHITTADGGTGKTTLKLYEAVCLALGDRFLGFDNKQKGKTLFITGEDTAQKLGAMLGAILKQMGLFDGSPENEAKIQTILESIVIKKDADLTLIQKDKMGFLTVNTNALNKVLEAVEDFQPKMIVFDPIASFWGSESALNDMNKAVAKFMSELVDKSNACVEMINHMGKQSSANKDMTQFAGRGGTGLPSHSRVSRVLRSLSHDEYKEMTGNDLSEDLSAMLCNVNKFTDGSPVLNKPFVIVRDGFLFSKVELSPAKEKEIKDSDSDQEKVFNLIKESRELGKYISKKYILSYLRSVKDPISEARIKHALNILLVNGFNGLGVYETENPDTTQKDKVLVIKHLDGTEI